MAIFRSADEFYVCIGGLLEKLQADSSLRDALADSGLVFRFRYADPAGVITIDAREGVNLIHYGEQDDPADIELRMQADAAHYFWMGQLDPLAEVFAGRIGVRGSLSKLSRLLPLLKPAMACYPDHLKEVGYDHLLSEL